MKTLMAVIVAALAVGKCQSVALAAEPVAPAGFVLGYEYDVTREKVPTKATLCRVVDIISALGYTQLQLYFKDVFAYSGHEEVWQARAHITPAEARELDDYCAARGVELVPYQATFSHLEPWLKFERYRALAEAPEAGVTNRWGGVTEVPMALCPGDPRSLPLLEDLLDQLLPCFRTKKVNTGCDEFIEFDDGGRRSRAAIAKYGVGKVYSDFVFQLQRAVAARGRTMMFWSDIIRDFPEYVGQIPKDAIALDWGYEADSPFATTTAALEKAPCDYYVCPGTSSWRSLVGRHANMIANVDNAFTNAVAHGASGLLLTDWGDNGYPQPWIVSLPSLVYTAARVRGQRLSDAEIAAEVDRICGCRCGEALIRYANSYLRANGNRVNATELFLLCLNGAKHKLAKSLTLDELKDQLAECRAAKRLRNLEGAPAWVQDDFALIDLLLEAAELRVNGVHDGLAAKFGPRYRELWCRQNRPEGVDKSIEIIFGNPGAVRQKPRQCVTGQAFFKAELGLKRMGTLKARTSSELRPGLWSVGFECLDRDYGDFEVEAGLAAELGVTRARLQSGWAKTERSRGRYDFAWLDHQVAYLNDRVGAEVWLTLGYGNPVYGCGGDLGMKIAPILAQPEAKAAWLKYVETVVKRYRTVKLFEVWNEPFNQAEAYRCLLVETARVIRQARPDARVMAAAMTEKDLRATVEHLVRESATELVDLWAYHSYTYNPDEDEMWWTVSGARKFEAWLQTVNPQWRLVQGEAGCPAQLEYAHALPGHEWTERKQAKWTLRKLCDAAAENMPYSVFTMMDLQYPNMLQSFGLIRCNAKHEFVYRRPAFAAVKNVFSFFGPEVVGRGRLTVRGGLEGQQLKAVGCRKGHADVVMIWDAAKVPADEVVWRQTPVAVEGVEFSEPVLVDLATGWVYAVPKGFKTLPTSDSPVMVTERSAVTLGTESAAAAAEGYRAN